MWNTLLFAHDFSSCAERVEPLVLGLAKLHGARIVIVHVTELPEGLSPEARITPEGHREPVTAGAHAAQTAALRLEQVAFRLRAEGASVEVRALLGAVPSVLLRAAKEVSADVIVMGTHGREGLRHFFLGSVAERVLRHATVPVVTLRTSTDEDSASREEQDLMDELTG